jgi:DNA repair exonuclease SbcCD nuclease subunit
MRLLLSGDPHLKISTIETAKKYLAWLEQTIETEKPDRLVIMGDLFDTHSVVRVEILSLWWHFFMNFFNRHEEVKPICLVGNHDQAGPGSKDHALVGLSEFIDFIDEPGFRHDIGGFIPYVHTLEEFKQSLEYFKQWRSVPYLFCHQTFLGAQYENGFYDPNGIPVELVDNFKLAISGHVHKVQRLKNILYVGSPYQANFSDANEPKGLWIFNTVTGKVEKIIENPLPKYHVVTFNSSDDLLKFFSEAPREDHFKIVFHGFKAGVNTLVDSSEFKQLKKKFKITFVPHFSDSSNKEVKISETLSIEKMLDVYVNDVLNTSLDKERLISTSKAILSEATQLK